MKVFKKVLFVIYSVLTLFAVASSAMLYIICSDIETDGYSEFMGTNYMLLAQPDESFGIPENSLLRFYASDSAYKVNDVVVCKNSQDELYIGVVTDYSNDADYVTYLVDKSGESVQVPKLYVLGQADNYSEFLGGIVASNQSFGARFLFLILPPLILLVGVVVIAVIVLIKRHKIAAEQSDYEEGVRFENAPLNTFEQNPSASKKERKPYINPHSHTELLKYDWLKEVAAAAEENLSENTHSAPAQAQEKPSQADSEKAASNDKSDLTDSEDISKEQPDKDAAAKSDVSKSENETTPLHDSSDIVGENVRQMRYSDDNGNITNDTDSDNKKTKNDYMINEMMKLINQNSDQTE